MLELAILGLLKDQAMHGYELKKRLADTLGSFWQVSYGSLYPALKRMQRQGAVEMIFPKEEIGRRRNVYRITPAGEELFAELLERAGAESAEDNGFSVRLAFFQYLKPETRLRLLERRRVYLEGRGSKLTDALRRSKERIDNYTLSLMNHELAATEYDIRWLDELIQAERLQVQVPAPPAAPKRAATRRPRPLAQKERA
jgi:DNA-binding PadR family transcriptional regulator